MWTLKREGEFFPEELEVEISFVSLLKSKATFTL